MIAIDINITGLDAELARLDRIGIGLTNLSPFFKVAGTEMMKSSQKNFLSGGRPAWPSLSQVTLLLRAQKKKSFRTHKRGKNKGRLTKKTFNVLIAGANPLRDTGHLMASIGNPAKGGIFRIEADSITIGTAVKYAEAHQQGVAKTKGFIKGKKIPKREFLKVQPEDETNILRHAREFVDRVIRRNKN